MGPNRFHITSLARLTVQPGGKVTSYQYIAVLLVNLTPNCSSSARSRDMMARGSKVRGPALCPAVAGCSTYPGIGGCGS